MSLKILLSSKTPMATESRIIKYKEEEDE